MTHDLSFQLKTKDKEVMTDLYDAIVEDDEFIELYQLRINQKNKKICSKNGGQPFIIFVGKETISEKDKGLYSVIVETGSHVGVEDTMEALHWFHFVQAFRSRFSGDVARFKKKCYEVSGEQEPLGEREMLKRIITAGVDNVYA